MGVEILIIIAIFAVVGIVLYIAEKAKPGSTDKFGEAMKEVEERKQAQRINLNSRELENEINKVRNAARTNKAWRR